MLNTLATNITRFRQQKGMTMEELATEVGVTKQAISHYENGVRTPDSITLLAIAKAFGYSIDRLVTAHKVSFKLNYVNYREGMSLSMDQRTTVEELASNALANYMELEAIAKENRPFDNPLKDNDPIRTEHDAEKAAIQLRKRWKLGDGPLHNLVDVLEKKGIRIIKVKFGYAYTHEGLSGWVDQRKFPVIILNDRPQDICRIRFTLLHELGHLLLIMADDLTIDVVEKLCNAFAGAIMLPTDILVAEFGRNRTAISMPELQRIKQLYGISVYAIMVRARRANLITIDAYQKWKTNDFEDYTFGHYLGEEEPQRFLQMLYRCLSENKIGLDKAAQLAGRSEADFRNILLSKISMR
ncbi:helix-turn-helix domain-containing protein [Larkinella humicola]|uniref:ImmA/IrrE family metallo-endopeptidase n=1 Tax=Larkinella humicola TaxID=2607654 RepID=A0A5N1JAM6_9BACT|nr:XRE family transcriptional regulator [Larkinella humicola]KAA9349732.1 ImmA/IrrE family metallo-endopeptidase [Larkinella humicola]